MRNVQCLRALLVLALVISPLAVTACGGSSGVINRTMDDGTLTTQVKTALLNEPGVDATQISVATAGGVVTLRGSVKSGDEEQKALATARRINGVREVKSELKVGG
jgi:osmotically-inducible protein OsmY